MHFFPSGEDPPTPFPHHGPREPVPINGRTYIHLRISTFTGCFSAVFSPSFRYRYGLTSTSLEEVYLNICDDRSAFSDAPLQSIIADLGAKIQPTCPITPPGHAFNGWATTNALAWKISTVRWRDRRAAAHFVIYPCFVIVVAFTVFGSHYFNLGVSDLTTGCVCLLPINSEYLGPEP
jgi:hypothetical protein